MSYAVQDGPILRVLVVDDYPDIAESMAMLLRLDGHTVEIAQNGSLALELAGVLQPHAVLCDLSMPGMSGYEVARRMRRLLGSKALLVAISGNDLDETRKCLPTSEFDHHLVKPANPAAVQRLLRRFAESLPGESPWLPGPKFYGTASPLIAHR